MILSAASPASEYQGLSASDIPAQMRSEPARPVTVSSGAPGSGSSGLSPVTDQVTLSPEGQALSRGQQSGQVREKENAKADSQGLSPEEQQAIQKLKQRDREVKAHEQAHLANAGQYAAGGPSYTYQTGPDGRRYAIGGEVPIDVSKEKTPEQTIRKMEVVRRAALAPANPSGADRAIAARASMTEAQARRELTQEKHGQEKTNGTPAAGQPSAGMAGPSLTPDNQANDLTAAPAL